VTPTDLATDPAADRRFFLFTAVVSAVALGLLTWLLVLRGEGAGTDGQLSFLPAVNAGLNATSALCLIAGFVAIKKRRPQLHRTMMVLALVASLCFFVSYVTYHYVHGDTKYLGMGPMRTVYFVVLVTHVLCSIPIVPAALLAVYFAVNRRFVAHKRVTRVALPVWLYVSVTGVLIFWLLRAGNAS
jgi:putative membrane protein